MSNSRWAAIGHNKQTDISSSSAQLHISGGCILFGVLIGTDGTNQVIVNVYDGKNSLGTQLYTPDIIIPGSSILVYIAPQPIEITRGVYVTAIVSGGGHCYHRVFYDI